MEKSETAQVTCKHCSRPVGFLDKKCLRCHRSLCGECGENNCPAK